MAAPTQNDPNYNHRFDVQKNSKLTVAYWRSGGGGGTNLSLIEAKKKIVKLLSGMQFGVNAVPLHKDRIIDAAGSVVDLTHEVRNNGTVMVLGNVTSNQDITYPIRNGAPLCFDMESGYAVTGVNPNWQADEYKLVGIAMGELDSGFQIMPMKFGFSSSAGGTVNRVAVLNQPLYKGKSAQAVLLKPVNQEAVSNGETEILQWGFDGYITVWDFLMPYEDDFIDQNVKIIVSQEPSSGLWILNNPACSPGGIETVNGSVETPPTS